MISDTSRREFIKLSGMLVVGVAAAGRGLAAQAPAGGPYTDPDFRQLDSWIVIRQDNTATFYVGKTDLGQGTGTAFRQIMSDELDINFDATSVVMGTTDLTVDQGGSGGSDALQTDGWPMRRVAAEARRVLLDMGAASLGVPVSQLAVSDAVITVKARSVEARDLRTARRRQALQRDAHGQHHRCRDRPRAAQDGAGDEDHGALAPALRHPAEGGRLAQVGRGRQGARHAARAQREAAGRRGPARERGRGVGAQRARPGEGGAQGQLPGRGVRARGAGDPGGAAAQGRVAEAGRGAVPRLRRSVHLHAQRHADVQRAAGGDRRPRRGVHRRRARPRSGLRGAVPGPHRHRPGARHGRSRRTASSPSTRTT